MAYFRGQDIAQDFRNDRQLQQFVLTDVTPTGRILGTGSFGSVEEVNKLFSVFTSPNGRHSLIHR